jgi:magnesium-protoporphyrin O-methyltransferase
MNCCAHCSAADAHFSEAAARQDLARYHKHGPIKTTRYLLDAVRGTDLRNGSLLDIGAGIGVIQHELLGDTIARATHVEAASAYRDEARRESAQRGHDGRVAFVSGDFVDLAGELEEADLVTLDRVVCCYPDYVALINGSAPKARRYYALSYPRDRWYVRIFTALENLLRRLTGNAFRTFVHPTRALESLLAEAGLSRVSRRDTLVWRVELYARDA